MIAGLEAGRRPAIPAPAADDGTAEARSVAKNRQETAMEPLVN
jgi:hypothetical protein